MARVSVITLAKQNPIVFTQMVLYLIAWISGFFICIPVGYQLRDFHGSCILFSQIVWNGRMIWPWADSTCEFVLYSNLGINIFYCAFMLMFFVLVLWPRTTARHYEKVSDVEKWSILHLMTGLNPVFCFINLIIVVLLLCAGAVLSAGFAQWCNWLLDAMAEEGNDLDGSCYNAQKLPWEEFRIRGGTSNGVRGSHFFDNMTVAIFFSWLNVIVWMIQLGLNLYRVCRRCSCEVAEEKKKYDKSMIIAARRSRMATPIGTPGGGYTPVNMGASMSQPYRPVPQQPPQYGQLNPQSLMGAPPQQRGGGQLCS